MNKLTRYCVCTNDIFKGLENIVSFFNLTHLWPQKNNKKYNNANLVKHLHIGKTWSQKLYWFKLISYILEYFLHVLLI